MHYYGRRLRGGGTFTAGAAASFSFVALYNDSTIGHILRVMNYIVVAGGEDATAFLATGTVGSLAGAGIALFAGEQQMAGAIYGGSDSNAPPFGLTVYLTSGQVFGSPTFTPWFYVRPGFSLVFKGTVANTTIRASFWWEDLEMSMLDPHELV